MGTLTWDIAIYLIGIAVLWGTMRQEIKGLKECVIRLEASLDKCTGLGERLALVEQSIKAAFRQIDEIKSKF